MGPRRRERAMIRLGWRRGAAAASTLALLIGTSGVGPGGPTARADTGGSDQVTGSGGTSSQVSVAWSAGLVGKDNQTVVAPRDPNSPESFMSDDFKNLKVTVSQTQNLAHQAVTVNWTGGKPTGGGNGFFTNFVQIMQCYGDANSGPQPENCEYGASNLNPTGSTTSSPWGRGGSRCAPGTPSTTNPLPTAEGNSAAGGCDPGESGFPSHLDPGASTENPPTYTVPFVPVGTSLKAWPNRTADSGTNRRLSDYFDTYSSNEVETAGTGSDGTGVQNFQLLTATESQGLGCGELEPSGAPRDCWLVLVPRGGYDPNGYHHLPTSAVPFIHESPLSASNWARRIQIHLGFRPLGSVCPIGAQEREIIGTELAARAMFSWQVALNRTARCKVIYGYSAAPQASNAVQLSNPEGVGMALTPTPVDFGGAGPPLVYAPVAVAAMTVPFHISQSRVGTGALEEITSPVKLTPRLLAKTLTQSYKNDLVDYNPSHSTPQHPAQGPPWAKNNPADISHDPEFQRLNPDIGTWGAVNAPTGPLLTLDHSSINAQVWSWIQSDPSARAWLNGAPDENGIVVNPNYRAVHLGDPPANDSFPRADSTCARQGVDANEPQQGACALDLLPYVNSLDEAATRVQAASIKSARGWDTNANGGTGGYASVRELPGATFESSITDSADLANYRLVPASLCNASGGNCAALNSDSVAVAVDSAKPDGTGLLRVDPANPAGHSGQSAYPLVSVIYAAVRTNQDPVALRDDATLLDYIAGAGQTPGTDSGQLPPGYLPLPNALRTQTHAVADTLRADADALPPPPSGPNQPTPGPSGGTGNSNGGSAAPTPSGHVSTPPRGVPGLSHLAGVDGSQSQLPVAFTGGPTPKQSLGALRWALLAILIAGLVGAVAGPMVKRPPTKLLRVVRRR